jgi:hypothetical protein
MIPTGFKHFKNFSLCVIVNPQKNHSLQTTSLVIPIALQLQNKTNIGKG